MGEGEFLATFIGFVLLIVFAGMALSAVSRGYTNYLRDKLDIDDDE